MFNCTYAKNAFFQQLCHVTNIKSLEYREKSEYRSSQNACLGCAWPARLFRRCCLASTSSHEIDSRLYQDHLTFHVFGIDKMSIIFWRNQIQWVLLRADHLTGHIPYPSGHRVEYKGIDTVGPALILHGSYSNRFRIS